MRPMSFKVAVAHAMCSPWVGRLVASTFGDAIPSRGLVVDTADAAVSESVKAMLLFRLYESSEQRFLRRYLRRDLDVVELGSSLGVISSQIARRLRPGRRLVGVEANPRMVALARRNVARNAPGSGATIVHAAVSYAAGDQATFYAHRDSLASSLTPTVNSSVTAVAVPATTLGALLREQRIVGDFALVSDIEGGEWDMLQHDAEALHRCQQLIIELHEVNSDGKTVTVDAMMTKLQEQHGFRLVDRHGPVGVFER